MTVALFLTLVQILGGLGGAGVSILTIKKDLEDRKLKPSDPLPPEHVAAVKQALTDWKAPVAS